MEVLTGVERKFHSTPIKINGKKTKLLPFICENLPKDFECWVEPFFGSGVVGINLAKEKAIFSDLNPHIINFYNWIKNEVDLKQLEESLYLEGGLLKEFGEKHYYEIREFFNQMKTEFHFLWLTRACFNGLMRFNSKGEFNVPYCKKDDRFSKSYITKILNEVKFVKDRIKTDWRFEVGSFEKILNKNLETSSLIFADPPYLGRFVGYFDDWKEKQEQTLYETLKNSGCKFMLTTWYSDSRGVNPMIEKYWKEFNIKTKEHRYQVGAKVENRFSVQEALVMNY